LADALRLRALAELGAHGLRQLGLLALRVLALEARRGREGPPRVVVDELRVDVREGAVHREARTRRAPADLLAHPLVAADAAFFATLLCHFLLPYAFAPTLPAFPALRRMCS